MNMPLEVILEDSPCPLGCIKDDKIILTGRDLIHDLPGEFTVVKCRTCGLIRTNPRPTPETIGFYYPDNYGPYLGTRIQQPEAESGWTLKIKDITKRTLKWLFRFNTNLLPPLTPGSLLEVGCASGAFMHQMATQGWQVEGIEFSPKAAQATVELGYPVHIGSLETASLPSKSFDLIAGFMVLEHLHNPILGLRKMHDWVKPGAWLVLSVPNCSSLEFLLFKKRWQGLHLPNHLYHYTPYTLSAILKNSGWKIEKIFHQRTLLNLIVSTGYLLRDKGFTKIGKIFINSPEKSGYWNSALYPLAWLLSQFGQTGRMTIWARLSE